MNSPGSAGRKPALEPAHQHIGALILHGSKRVGVPFGAVHIVDGDEGGLAAHGQAYILRLKIGVDVMCYLLNPLPIRLGEGLG